MTVLAHIAGMPVEETLLGFAPLGMAGAGLAAARVGGAVRRRRPRALVAQSPPGASEVGAPVVGSGEAVVDVVRGRVRVDVSGEGSDADGIFRDLGREPIDHDGGRRGDFVDTVRGAA